VIENRPGASGTIGAELVFRADPDGYTLMSTPPAPLVINQRLYEKLPYDPWQFVPVTVMAQIPSVLLVHPKVTAQSVPEFVDLIRSNPNRFNYASQGTTTVSFLTTEWFMARAGGLKITHVPYKGTGPGLAALLAGEVELMFDNLGTSLTHVRAGRLKALAVCGEMWSCNVRASNSCWCLATATASKSLRPPSPISRLKLSKREYFAPRCKFRLIAEAS